MKPTDKPASRKSEELTKLLELLSDSSPDNWDDNGKVAERISTLKDLSSFLNQVHTFRPGDVVQWKPGLKNRKRPDYGEPAIVISTLDTPIFDASEEAGSPYFHEPLTVVLGVVDPDGDLILFHFDGRRFEPMT